MRKRLSACYDKENKRFIRERKNDYKRTAIFWCASRMFHSGQCFRMVEREDGIWQVVASNRYLEIKQEGTAVIFSCSEKEYETFWKFYFDM